MGHCTAPPPCWQNSALPRPGISPRFKGKPWSVTGADGEQVEQMSRGKGNKISITSLSQSLAGMQQGWDVARML